MVQRAQGVAGRFELAAGDDDPAIARELQRHGFAPSSTHAALIGAAEPERSDSSGAAVEQVTNDVQMEAFLAAYVRGWGIPAAAADQFKRNVWPWLGQPGWSLYLARVDGQPAATAILYVHAGVGYFADGATDPAFRRRGLHAALLHRR